MSTNEMRTEFRQQFAEGRVKAQGVIQKLAADAGADMRERAADVAHGVEDRLNMLRQKGERLAQRLR
jgi:hypothetical protein